MPLNSRNPVVEAFITIGAKMQIPQRFLLRKRITIK